MVTLRARLGRPARIAYLIDPRFAGGTSSAVAQELRVASRVARVSVHGIQSTIFQAQAISPQVEAALADLDLTMHWDNTEISADVVVVHNPLFLRGIGALGARIVARHLVVVAHENFLQPGDNEAFDIAHCLGVLDRATLAMRKSVAPISANNRCTVVQWWQSKGFPDWSVLPTDWFNICEFPLVQPTSAPADRRGRHSRPGFEKFPGVAAMDHCFPRHADANVLLGADTFITDGFHRPHWQMHAFKSMDVADYFDQIDFMVYFTSPSWRESFGRTLAEGIAAGKVVISDQSTASTFGGAVVAALPQEVDGIISDFVGNPAQYADHVRLAQGKLKAFSGMAFLRVLEGALAGPAESAA